ncbi:hypothetical protein D6Z43_10295 [Pseudomonas sp. DY-1]|uniref:hypothetical protein n=1 Tax=Pseudomonas sp. DY-1 TaxID=1755504 RepID=UPI000EA9BA18|nr:hypothetical protein [Pseudomonas sp. DY-1]AYF87517.1 hypothetical protein D6Z43_10295 [Pseudomonas sp. DY-1]
MSRRFVWVVAVLALSFVAVLIFTYISTFGVHRSLDQGVWGAFGDYFGGILNPIFALFAFLGVLSSLDLQTRQIKQLARDKHADEILQVIKDIDARLTKLQETYVGHTSGIELHITHMVAESERVAKGGAASSTYKSFVQISNEPGAVLEAAVREMAMQIDTMCRFMQSYPRSEENSYAPMIDYYATKASRLTPMLKDIGILSDSASKFFEARAAGTSRNKCDVALNPVQG